MIQDLSIFLQYSLRAPDEDVTIEQEIEATTHYTALMAHRYAGQVQVHWDVDPEAQNYRIPKLILQPMIENSVTHGNNSQANPLDIFIYIAVRDELLTIQVRDNGNGVSPGRLEELRNSLSSFEGFHEKTHWPAESLPQIAVEIYRRPMPHYPGQPAGKRLFRHNLYQYLRRITGGIKYRSTRPHPPECRSSGYPPGIPGSAGRCR